jgi:hypothetical protein
MKTHIKVIIKKTFKNNTNKKKIKNNNNKKYIKKNYKKTIKNNKNNKKLVKQISIRTNVESGYSATSFPFVFVRKNPYNLKNNNNKKKKKSFRTTALVAPLLHK